MKKNPEKELERFRGMFFLVGVVLALVVALFTLQYTVVEKWLTDDPEEVVEYNPASDPIPQTFRTALEKPKDVANNADPDVFLPEPNFVEPTIVMPTNGPDLWSEDYADITPIPMEGDADIPVSEVEMDRLPIFPGCEDLTNDERKKCMSLALRTEIQQNLKLSQDDIRFLSNELFYVEFVVGTDGRVSAVKLLRSPSANIETQVLSIMNELPQFVPGRAHGRNQAVKLYLPIRLNIR